MKHDRLFSSDSQHMAFYHALRLVFTAQCHSSLYYVVHTLTRRSRAYHPEGKGLVDDAVSRRHKVYLEGGIQPLGIKFAGVFSINSLIRLTISN